MKRMTYLILFFMTFFTVAFAQETVIIEDNLLGSTVGSRIGGTLTAEGYKPGIGANHIFYDVPSQVVNGYVQFEIKGFAPSLIVDAEGDADNGFVGMYDGRGIPEPCAYFDNFKLNYFRWNVHWRQNRNAFKAVLNCAAPTAARLNSTYAKFASLEDRDWVMEPVGNFFSFNATQWYTVKVEWNDKDFKVTVNGTTVWSVLNGPYDYAPIDFKIWLGSAPGYADKYTNAVQNIIYRNFKLVKYGPSSGTAPVITSTAVTSGLVGQLYSYDVNATGSPVPTYSLTTFPSGMVINSTTGLIQWTPTAAGNFNVTVKAANGVSPDDTQSFGINVQSQNSAPVITSTAVTSGSVGQLYSYDVNATGSPTPTYSLTTFPSGMTISSVNGLIQWTPAAAGNFNVTVKAANGISPDATQTFVINVSEASPCPAGIISYWNLDETSGSVYDDYVGSNNATSTNNPTPVAGRVNGARLFNGTSNRITAARIAAYDFSANSSFSFEAWIKHPAGSYVNREMIIGRKATENSLSIWLGFEPTANITFSVRSKTGESNSVVGPNLYDGNWHHVVGVQDGTLNQLRIYVDGVLSNTKAASYNSGFDSPTAKLSIGYRDVGGAVSSFFNGSIDEAAVYNTVLDAASILQHYNNGLQNNGYCDEPTSGTPTTTNTFYMTSGTDDIMYYSDNQFSIYSRFGESNNKYVGIEQVYKNVTIPPNATITSAMLEVKAKASNTGTAISDIYSDLRDNPSSIMSYIQFNGGTLFSTETFQYSAPAFTINNLYQIDITNVIQDRVNKLDWNSGDNLGLIIKGNDALSTNSLREITRAENSLADNKLIITYSTGLPKFANGNENETEVVPDKYELSQNYPNPFNPSTIISWQLPVSGRVSLKIYDILGNEVAVLVNENKEAGYYETRFNGSAHASGLYIYRLTTENYISTKKMLMIK